MPFSIRPYRRVPVQCPITYNAGPSGISPVPVGDSLAIFRYELERSAH